MALEGVQASEARHPGRTERGNGEAGPEAGRDEALSACRKHEGLGREDLLEQVLSRELGNPRLL